MTSPKSASAAHSRTHPRPVVPSYARERFNPDLLGILAAVVAALLYIPALQYGWIWDDGTLVGSHGGSGAPGFHPAVTALYRGEWLVGVGSPALYHFTSIALHVLATWLFFRLIRNVGASAGIAFGATLLFAAHPIHVEAVAYVTGRPDLLATVCALGALLIARSAPVCAPGGCRSWRVYPAYALLAIAVLSDEVALVTPLLLMGLDRWGSPRVPTKGRTTVYVGFAAVALAGILARIGAHQLRMNEPHELLAAGAGAWGPVIAAYEFLRAMVVPHPLNAMRSLTEAEAASGTLRLTAVASLAALALFVWWRRSDALARTGTLLLLLPLIPALPISPFQGAYVEERAAYFASVGFCFLAASLYRWLASREGARTAVLALAVVAAGVAGTLTLKRLPVWKDNVALLADALRHDPKDPAPYLGLADQYLQAGNYPAAVGSLDRAIALDSTDADSHQKRTILLIRMGRLPEAEISARRSVQLRPGEAVFWANLGDLLTRQGKTREALEANRRAVRMDAKNESNWYNLGVALGAADSLPGAIDAYRRVIEINPNHFQAVNNLGAVLAASGRIQEARDAYAKAVQLAPASVESRMNLALASLRLGDTPAAMAQRDPIQKLDRVAAQQLLEIVQQYEAARPPQRTGGAAR